MCYTLVAFDGTYILLKTKSTENENETLGSANEGKAGKYRLKRLPR
jgi:hypothetical protein